MRLFLCRHGEAVASRPGGPWEAERWLTARGRADAEAVGRLLAARGEQVDAVMTSPLVRAVQTAEAMARALGYAGEVRVARWLSGSDSAAAMLDRVRDEAPGWNALMLVGHQPGIGELALRITGLAELPQPMAPATVLCLDFEPLRAGPGRLVFQALPGGDAVVVPG